SDGSQGNGTTIYGGQTLTGLENDTFTLSGTDSYSVTTSSTLVAASSDSYSLTAQGVFAKISFSFSSWVYQDSSADAGTQLATASGSYRNQATDTTTGTGNQSAQLAQGSLSGSDLGTIQQNSHDSFTDTGTFVTTTTSSYAG